MDSCDEHCPAKALETWMHQVTGEILRFCRHHSREKQGGLYDAGFRLVEALAVPA